MQVSVIVRTYNRAYAIRDALESALKQSYHDFELIVVDDGSTDHTSEVVQSFCDERIRLVRHERNRGVAAACNSGISAARGEFVAFLDSDDIWKPSKLERQVDFLLRYAGIDAVFCDVEIREGANVIPSLMGRMRAFPKLLEGKPKREDYALGRREMYLCLLEEVPVKPTALLVRREVFAKVGTFDETSQSGEDWEFLLRLSQSACFGYINLPLATHRWMLDATHRKYWEQDKAFLLRIFLNEKLKLRNDNKALEAINRGIYGHCSNLAYHLLYSGRRRESITIYLQGFRETGEFGMLLRAASALLPLAWRDFARKLIGEARSSSLGLCSSLFRWIGRRN